MINDFWKNPIVKNYLVCNIFDVDEIVRCYGGCPNDEDYKIERSYYYWEWQGDENWIITLTSKEDYKRYKDSEEEHYRTEINYKEFENVFWFDEFVDFLKGIVEPDIQFNFISFVNETFNDSSFEGQAKVFLKDLFSSLKSLRDDLKILSHKRDRNGLEKTNKIQKFVIEHYSNSYDNTIDKLVSQYESIYPELINEFKQSEKVIVPDEKNPNIVDIEGVRKFNMEIPEDAFDFLILVTRNSKYQIMFSSIILAQKKQVNYGEYLNHLREGNDIFFQSRMDMMECFEFFIKDLHFNNIFYKFLIENKVDSETVKKQKANNLLDGLVCIINYLWDSTAIYLIVYALEERDPEFHSKLKNDNLFFSCLIDYQCYVNLKNIYDLIMSDYISFVDQTKYKFNYFYSNKKEETKKSDSVLNVAFQNSDYNNVLQTPTLNLNQYQHSEIFKKNAFEIWNSLFEIFKIVKESRTDVKFIFEEMKKDNFIHNTVSQKSFLDWINNIYSLDIEKTSNHSRTKERISIYNTAKSIYKD